MIIDLNYNDTDFEDKIINLPKDIKIVNIYGHNINITNLCNILENVKSNVEIKSNHQKEIDDEFLKRNTYQGFNRSILNMVKKICSENITKNDYKSYPSEYYPGFEYKECILSKKLIDEFIDRVSSIDIKEYIKLIKSNKVNIKPYRVVEK